MTVGDPNGKGVILP